MESGSHHYQSLVHEAVQVCGTDVAAIEAYIEAKLRTLTPEQRDAIRREIQLVLGFRAPDQSPFKEN